WFASKARSYRRTSAEPRTLRIWLCQSAGVAPLRGRAKRVGGGLFQLEIMSDTTPASRPELDDATLAYAEQVFDCARNGDTATLVSLLERGLPPNLLTARGESLLMLASYHGHRDTVLALLTAGADPEIRNARGHSILAGAVFKGHEEVVNALLEQGCDVEGRAEDGKTAFMTAAMFNRIAMMNLLRDYGADPKATDNQVHDARIAATIMGADEALRGLDKHA